MKLGLDTSVVLRLLVGLPADHTAIARQRLEQAHADDDLVIVTDTVLAEAYHALVHHYRIEKSQARALLHRMVTSGTVIPEPQELVAALEPSLGAGFVDRLILNRHRSLHASTITFDRALGAAGAVRLVTEAPGTLP